MNNPNLLSLPTDKTVDVGDALDNNIDIDEMVMDVPVEVVHKQLHMFGTPGSDSDVNTTPLSDAKQYDISDPRLSLRKCIIGAKGCDMLTFDFKQMELRIIAALSGDPVLLKQIDDNDTHGVDVFKNMASLILKMPTDKVTDQDRQTVKTVCYGIIYGMGSKALGRSLDITADQAGELLESFYRVYGGVKKLKDQVLSDARQNGIVRTATGRSREIKGFKSNDKQRQAAAERKAFNHLVQGTAADILKTCAIKVDDFISCFAGTGDGDSWDNGDARIVLLIHDEILMEVKRDVVPAVIDKVKHIMEHAAYDEFGLRVRMAVKVRRGAAWGTCVELGGDVLVAK